MEFEQVLQAPINTELTSKMGEGNNIVTFKVALRAKKTQIRAAVEALYGVSVVRVNTLVNPGERKRRGPRQIRRSSWKKAYVKLKEGDSIEFLENA